MAESNKQVSTSLPAKSFYGSKRKALDRVQLTKLRKIEEQAEKFKKFPLPLLPLHPTLSSPCTIYKLFRKQEPAIQFCQETGQGLKPFSSEDPRFSGGIRKYQAAHPCTIWIRQQATQPLLRNNYEIITEDAPCKLYFDLEFELELNPGTKPQELTHTFMEIVCWALEAKLNVKCTAEDVIILEATTPQKFSQHWIFPTVIFHSYRHVGAFVKHVIELIDAGSVPFAKSALEALPVRNNNGKTAIFVDKGVYTKNRNFRIYQSTKLGKNNPLVVSPENRYRFKKEKSFFLASLITYIQDPTLPAHTFESETCATTISHGIQSLSVQASSEGYNESPYPEIDNFIASLIHPQGRISKWLYFEQSKRLVYSFYNYRYCENVRRHHKSNNIQIVVDLDGLSYCQKCLDPDCGGFRSRSRPLTLTKENQGEGWDDSVPNDVLIASVEAAEALFSELAIYLLFVIKIL